MMHGVRAGMVAAAGDTGAVALRARHRGRPRPRTLALLLIWVLGLWAAFYANAPVPSSEALVDHGRLLRKAADAAPRAAAARAAVVDARRARRAATPFLWRLRADDAARARAASARARLVAAEREAADAERDHEARLRAARSALGLWSDSAVEEARSLFWAKFRDGKRFAVRQTGWDVWHALMWGRREDNALDMALHWVLQVVANITGGALSAVVGFVFHLPWLIYSYGPTLLSGLLFWAACSTAAAAVTAAWIGVVGGAAVASVTAAAALSRTQLRLGGGQGGHARGRVRYHRD